MAQATVGFPSWRDTSPQDRADILKGAVATMRARRDELSARIIYESGKPWAEADA